MIGIIRRAILIAFGAAAAPTRVSPALAQGRIMPGRGDAKPSYGLAIDPLKGIWSFTSSKLSAAASINPLDGVKIDLSVNGNDVGSILFPFDQLEVRCKLDYKGANK